jgi:hypothetical protein
MMSTNAIVPSSYFINKAIPSISNFSANASSLLDLPVRAVGSIHFVGMEFIPSYMDRPHNTMRAVGSGHIMFVFIFLHHPCPRIKIRGYNMNHPDGIYMSEP